MTHSKAREEGFKIFVSHSMEDREQAGRLVSSLSRRDDVRVFDPDTLNVAEDWPSKLREELLDCNVFLLLLSPNFVDSKWALQELGAAWAANKPIIAATTRPGVEYRLPVDPDHVQYLELQELEKPEVVNDIIARYEQWD